MNHLKSYKFDNENESDEEPTAVAIQESEKRNSPKQKIAKRASVKRAKAVSKKTKSLQIETLSVGSHMSSNEISSEVNGQ